MCGRYTLTDPDPRMLAERFGASVPEQFEARPRFNIAPTDPVLAVRERSTSERSAGVLRWDLVPHWVDELSSKPLMINARAEGIAERPAWRDAFERRRCLICADGFYEWRAQPDGTKRPVWIHRDDGMPFAFAGLWASWRPPGAGEDEDPVVSCAIVTTQANEQLAPVHERMPVVLAPDQESTWLAPGAERDTLLSIVASRPWEGFDLREVNRRVNDVANDGPELLDPPEPPDQTALF